MKDDNIKFRNLDIYYNHGEVSHKEISFFEHIFKIKLPKLYIEFISKYNAPSIVQNYFNYYDSYHNENSLASFSFDGFVKENNTPIGITDILAQYLYDDETYGYPHVYSFGSTAEGNWVCFDYRDDPQGNEPKICIVIHDEYDDETGKHLLFPVADNFEQFLDGLYEFDWSQFDEIDGTE